jgi:hypothetical protein
MGVHWGAVVLHIGSVRDLYLIGLETKVPVGVFSVDVEEGGSDEFVVKVKVVKWGYSRLSALRDFLTEENSGKTRTPVFTAMPAGLAISAFFMLNRLGFNRRWFRTVNADPTVVPFKANNDLEVLRNIAYIHAVLRFVVDAELNPRMRLHRNEKAPMTHAVLMRSNYNADKSLIQRHVKPETMKKLPKVTLT